MTLGSFIDTIVMTVILLLAFDALRRVHFFTQPLQTISFALLCIGAFGKLAWNVGGHDTPWWAICMHTGFAIYAVRVFGTGAFAAGRPFPGMDRRRDRISIRPRR